MIGTSIISTTITKIAMTTINAIAMMTTNAIVTTKGIIAIATRKIIGTDVTVNINQIRMIKTKHLKSQDSMLN